MEAYMEATEKRLTLWPTSLCLGAFQEEGRCVDRSALFKAGAEGPFRGLVSSIVYRLHFVVPMGWWEEAFDLLAVYANHVGRQLFTEHGAIAAAGSVCAFLVEHESAGNLVFAGKATFRADLEKVIEQGEVARIADFLHQRCQPVDS